MTVETTPLHFVDLAGDPLLPGFGLGVLLVVLGVLLMVATPRHLAGLVVAVAGVTVLGAGAFLALAATWLFPIHD
jgi:hypothetical protein